MARVLISMPEEFLSRIDEVAEGENRTRSELIREALRSYMYKSRVKSSTIATISFCLTTIYSSSPSFTSVPAYLE